jgi:hypothetical protein
MHRFIPAMASVAGARVREVPVRHHARQFGQSKYGLSRIYKVLLDLLSIKTITTFAQRPLIWFALMAAPFITMSILFLGIGISPLISGEGIISIPFAGTGVLFGAVSFFLVLSGALSELVYVTSDVDLTKYPLMTARSIFNQTAAAQKETRNPDRDRVE